MDRLYLATTYLKLLTADSDLQSVLRQCYGDRLEEVISSDFLYGDDIKHVFHAFEVMGLDSWLLRFGSPLSIASHGPLGFAVLSAPDLHTAMQVLADYFWVRTSLFSCKFEHDGQRARYISEDQTGNPVIERWMVESGAFVAQRLIEAVMTHPLGENAEISFTHAQPRYHEKLQATLNVSCRYNAAENAISFPASWCRIASPLSDPETFNSNLQKCKELKLKLLGSNNVKESSQLALDQFFLARIAGQARARELPTLEHLAQQHNCSARTFSRKLKSHQSSYKSLLEDCRRRYAVDLLSNTHNSVADIALQLGYQEPANFVRAFKSWFHTSPGVWRKQP